MRVLIIPSWYPTPAKPVSGIFVRAQADALCQAHDVRVLYLDVLSRRESRAARHWASTDRGYVEEVVEVPNMPLLWQFTYLLYLVRAFRALRHRFPPDVIHCQVAVPAGWGGALLRRLFKVPVVLTEHSSEFGPWLKRPGLRWMARRAFAGADVVIAVSEGQRQSISRDFGPVRRIVVVPNVVDTGRFAPAPFPPIADGYRLLFVGLMDTPQKGVPVLLEAIAKLAQAGDLRLHLDLVGDGRLRAGYEAQAHRLGLDGVVTFHGLQPHTEMAQFFQDCHAFVLPSLHESQGLVAIEALASGRPVVVTRCGGPEYLVDATNGLIVEPGQALPLAGAISQLLAHLDRYDPYQIAADAARRYSYEAVAAALTGVYTAL